MELRMENFNIMKDYGGSLKNPNFIRDEGGG